MLCKIPKHKEPVCYMDIRGEGFYNKLKSLFQINTMDIKKYLDI